MELLPMASGQSPRGKLPSPTFGGAPISGSIVTVVWCLLAGIAVVFSRVDHWPPPWPDLTLLPAAVGGVLLAVVVLRIVRSLREPRPTLFLTTARSESGMLINLRFTFPAPVFDGRRAVAVVRCERYTTLSDGETTEERLWTNRCTMRVHSGECAGVVKRPQGLPPTPPGRKSTDVWYVDLECGGYWLVYAV
ncbi:hypothetical protein [Limnoglobus roseus]|uniref:Uncharacterized protein n=1 Tax=Limnoglobus roseus TaxID=2598579 RepID=A0A5C1AKA7_9BACT|nr:hypothetical protein [Limnoglobus roseus]QEL18633.1 hypothetical protein PX52LOC_05666 [Limnoglobus roseus]